MVVDYAAVDESTILPIAGPSTGTPDVLTDLIRDGARRLLAEAVGAEVSAWIDAHTHLPDQAGRRQVVRNGYLPDRAIQTGLSTRPGFTCTFPRLSKLDFSEYPAMKRIEAVATKWRRTPARCLGEVQVKQPRVLDRRPADRREKFTSAILPPYLNRPRSPTS